MDFDLAPEHQALRLAVRAFAEGEVAPAIATYDADATFPYPLVREMARRGWLGLLLPAELGGGGAGTVAFAVLVEELARIDSSVAITTCASQTLGGLPLVYFGTDAQKKRWLGPLARGEVLGALALTEEHAGSDAAGIETQATLDGETWVLDGTKRYITNAGTDLSGFVVVVCQTGTQPDGRKETSMILVPRGTPGYTTGPPYRKLGWRASDTRPLAFRNCRVPEDHLIGTRGRGVQQVLRVLDTGRIGVAALSVGLAQGCLEQSVAYARQRRQFGRALGEFQAIQFKLADVATEVEMARLATYRAAWLRDSGRPFAREASMAKLYASEAAVRAADAAMQIHGGTAFVEEAPVARFYRDAKVLTIGEGTSEIQRLVIARSLLAATDS